MVDDSRLIYTVDYIESHRKVYPALLSAIKKMGTITGGKRSESVIEAKLNYRIEYGSPELHVALEALGDRTRVRVEVSEGQYASWGMGKKQDALDLLLRQLKGSRLNVVSE